MLRIMSFVYFVAFSNLLTGFRCACLVPQSWLLRAQLHMIVAFCCTDLTEAHDCCIYDRDISHEQIQFADLCHLSQQYVKHKKS
ncbi:hypothetical protein O6H91_01G030700 [Diphasiastrum complanatum]|uniref:Uncharacterized protein n=1 Tax=Diphasiastrum complanatum TaxID=34168 RepID=A0ACC2EPG4_DIPCM|nr:hypothetical protein O6H91_01G030700 [Diphasiastrum complanatum]